VKKKPAFTHRSLVDLAVRWLRGRQHRCKIVFAEIDATWEVPDAIGWKNGLSTLVECKNTRSDFLSDKRKRHRKHQRGMGHWRWFLTPPGVTSGEELPPGWGLAEATPSGTGVRVLVKPAPNLQCNHRAEATVLTAAIRRYEVGVLWYEKTAKFESYMDTKKRKAKIRITTD
jgi:hypothetical protein